MPLSKVMKIATGQIIQIEKISLVQFHTIVESKLEKMKLTNIYYYPGLNLNLISLSQLDYIKMNFKIKRGVIFISKGEIIYFKIY